MSQINVGAAIVTVAFVFEYTSYIYFSNSDSPSWKGQSYPVKFVSQRNQSININNGKIKAAWGISFFPFLKLNDWISWKIFRLDFSGKSRNLDSDWLAQIIYTKMKCRNVNFNISTSRHHNFNVNISTSAWKHQHVNTNININLSI